MARARTVIEPIKLDVLRDLNTIRSYLPPHEPDSELENALAGLETFIAVACRVLSKTNPSKIQSEAKTVEISHHLRKLGA